MATAKVGGNTLQFQVAQSIYRQEWINIIHYSSIYDLLSWSSMVRNSYTLRKNCFSQKSRVVDDGEVLQYLPRFLGSVSNWRAYLQWTTTWIHGHYKMSHEPCYSRSMDSSAKCQESRPTWQSKTHNILNLNSPYWFLKFDRISNFCVCVKNDHGRLQNHLVCKHTC
jgi:hypothetical protein